MRYLPFLLLAGCAQALAPADQGTALARVAGAPTGPARACVSPSQGEAMMVVDKQGACGSAGWKAHARD